LKNRQHRGLSSRDLAQQLDTPGTKYDGEDVERPAHMTVLKAKRELLYRTIGVKLRPAISAALEPVRVDCAQYIIANAALDKWWCDNDEKYFTVPLLRKADVHPDSDEEDDDNYNVFFKTVSHKKHIPKIMVFAIVSRPILQEGWTREWDPENPSVGQPGDQWLTDGKVFICRCTMEEQRQRGRKKKDADGKTVRERRVNPETQREKWYEVYDEEAGSWKEVDVPMDGEMYYDIHVNRGALQAIRDYQTAAGNRRGTVEQNDGAPGHAYNNRATGANGMPGAPTTWHEHLQKEAGKLGITIYKQSAHSPELNRLDLGVWSCLNAGVRRRWKDFMDYATTDSSSTGMEKILDRLWAVVQDEWKKMDPAKLWVISEHKINIARQVVAAEGKKLRKEAHSGARKAYIKAKEAARAK
jgi:hypothetical protein